MVLNCIFLHVKYIGQCLLFLIVKNNLKNVKDISILITRQNAGMTSRKRIFSWKSRQGWGMELNISPA